MNIRTLVICGLWCSALLGQTGIGLCAAAAASSGDAAATDNVQHKVLAFNLEGYTDKGAKKWQIDGKSAEAISPTEIRLNDIVAKTFGNEGEATITADQGVYDKSKNNVRLEKNVQATIDTSPAYASQFADLSGQALTMQKTTPAAPAKEEKRQRIAINCDGSVEFDYEKNLAVFNTNVHVVSQDGTIDADKITVHLDPATKKIYDIVAEGNVKIVRGENIVYSDTATYVERDKKIVLIGKPKLVIYQDGGIVGDITAPKK